MSQPLNYIEQSIREVKEKAPFEILDQGRTHDQDQDQDQGRTYVQISNIS